MMNRQMMILSGAALVSLLWLTACDDDGGSSPTNGGTNQTNQTNQNFVPTSLAARTFSFTTTDSQQFSEPTGSNFTVTFTDESNFSYTPSSQNPDGPGPVIGSYTFDPNSRTVILSGNGRQDTILVFNFTAPGTGTAHLTHPDGGTLDANFVQTGG